MKNLALLLVTFLLTTNSFANDLIEMKASAEKAAALIASGKLAPYSGKKCNISAEIKNGKIIKIKSLKGDKKVCEKTKNAFKNKYKIK